jgi:drug/metabolite transporter (DMT)-like permease
LQHLPLAEAIAVAFTAPLFVTALAGPLLGEAVDARRWGAVIVGFLGAVIMVQPGSAAFRPEALLVLGSAFAFSLLVMLTRRMTRTETNVALLSYSTLFAGAWSLPFLPFVWQAPATGDVKLFVAIGLIGGVAAFCIIQAYRHAPVSVLAPFDYTALIWGALFGWQSGSAPPSSRRPGSTSPGARPACEAAGMSRRPARRGEGSVIVG